MPHRPFREIPFALLLRVFAGAALTLTASAAHARDACFETPTATCFHGMIVDHIAWLAPGDDWLQGEILRRVDDYATPGKAHDPALGRALLTGIERVEPVAELEARHRATRLLATAFFVPDWPGTDAFLDGEEPDDQAAAVLHSAAVGRAVRGDWKAYDALFAGNVRNNAMVAWRFRDYAVAAAAGQDAWDRAARLADFSGPEHPDGALMKLVYHALDREAWTVAARALDRLHDRPEDAAPRYDPLGTTLRIALGGLIVAREGAKTAFDAAALFDATLADLPGDDARTLYPLAATSAAYEAHGFAKEAARMRDALPESDDLLLAMARDARMLAHRGHDAAAARAVAPLRDALLARFAAPEPEGTPARWLETTAPESAHAIASVLIRLGREDEAREVVEAFRAYDAKTAGQPSRPARYARERIADELTLPLYGLEAARAAWQETEAGETNAPEYLATAGLHDILLDDLGNGRSVWVAHRWEAYAETVPDPEARDAFLRALLDDADRKMARGNLPGPLVAMTPVAARLGDWERAEAYFEQVHGLYRLDVLLKLATLASDDMRAPLPLPLDFY